MCDHVDRRYHGKQQPNVCISESYVGFIVLLIFNCIRKGS